MHRVSREGVAVLCPGTKRDAGVISLDNHFNEPVELHPATQSQYSSANGFYVNHTLSRHRPASLPSFESPAGHVREGGRGHSGRKCIHHANDAQRTHAPPINSLYSPFLVVPLSRWRIFCRPSRAAHTASDWLPRNRKGPCLSMTVNVSDYPAPVPLQTLPASDTDENDTEGGA